MVKGIENSFLELLEAEVNQIGICVEGIRTFLKLAKEEEKRMTEKRRLEIESRIGTRQPEGRKGTARLFGAHFYSRVCPICEHTIDIGQAIPPECAIETLTSPFRDVEGWMHFYRIGICQDCQDEWFGKKD